MVRVCAIMIAACLSNHDFRLKMMGNLVMI